MHASEYASVYVLMLLCDVCVFPYLVCMSVRVGAGECMGMGVSG